MFPIDAAAIVDGESNPTTDGAVTDATTADCWLNAACVPSEKCAHPCGVCKQGTESKTCGDSGLWLIPSDCSSDDECIPGTTRFDGTSCPAGQSRDLECNSSCEFVPVSTCSVNWQALPPSPLAGRYDFGDAVLNDEWYIVMGFGSSVDFGDVARYSPATETWTLLPAAPILGRRQPNVVATDTEIFIWGGYRSGADPYLGDGARYRASTNKWSMVSANGGPGKNLNAALAWDDAAKRVLLWGGKYGSWSYGISSDGYAYAPAEDKWSKLSSSPLAARQNSLYAWDAKLRRFYIWGGHGASGYLADGAYFDAATNTWTSLPSIPSIQPRERAATAILDGKFVFWGGWGTDFTAFDDGASFDPSTSTWTLLPKSPIGKRTEASFASNDSLLFVVAGQGEGNTLYDDGAIFDGATSSWSLLPNTSSAPHYKGGSAWTPKGFLSWGGNKINNVQKSDGALYKPAQ